MMAVITVIHSHVDTEIGNLMKEKEDPVIISGAEVMEIVEIKMIFEIIVKADPLTMNEK